MSGEWKKVVSGKVYVVQQFSILSYDLINGSIFHVLETIRKNTLGSKTSGFSAWIGSVSSVVFGLRHCL